jgi:inosine-uridine nucleoside N-ribohydrolase
MPVVAMGGWVRPPADGFPPWGPEYDWNVQCDTRAAELVAATADLTLSLLPATMPANLRTADLPRLRASGPLGELLARQSTAFAEDVGRAALRRFPGLPDDLVNFHWDPLACAVALRWPGATVDRVRLRPVLRDGVLRFEPDEHGRETRILTGMDGDAFRTVWIEAVEAAQR